MRRAGTAALALLLAPACQLVRDGEEVVTPQRPTFSSDTGTTSPGTFELEAGAAVDPGDSLDTPVELKYGLGARSEVFLGFSPWKRVELPGDDGEGPGDVTLGARHRFLEGSEGGALAWQGKLALPVADEDEGLGSGELDAFLAGIASQTLGQSLVTLYYELGLLGDPEGGAELQHAVALAASHLVHERLSVFGEVVEVFDPADTDPVVLTLGVTHYPVPSLALDAAVAAGLDDEAPDLQLLFGLTTNLGRLLR